MIDIDKLYASRHSFDESTLALKKGRKEISIEILIEFRAKINDMINDLEHGDIIDKITILNFMTVLFYHMTFGDLATESISNRCAMTSCELGISADKVKELSEANRARKSRNAN